MSITYQFARRFEGRPVMAYCRDGRRHYGILSQVTPTAIHLRPLPYHGVPVSNESLEKEIVTAEEKNATQLDIIETGLGYGYRGRGYGYRYGFGGPAWWYGAGIVLPLYVLLALSLFWW